MSHPQKCLVHRLSRHGQFRKQSFLTLSLTESSDPFSDAHVAFVHQIGDAPSLPYGAIFRSLCLAHIFPSSQSIVILLNYFETAGTVLA